MKLGFAITAYDKFEEAKILFEILRNEFKGYYPISFCSNHPKSKEFVSPTVTAVKTPEKVNGDKFVSHMWKKYGVLIAGAWGPDLSGKVLRLGNMGYCANIHLVSAALAAFEKTLHDFGVVSKLGTAVGTFMDKL